VQSPPSKPSTTIGRQWAAISPRAAHNRGPTTGASSASAIAHRQNVSATGGTRSASSRPTIQLPDQKRAASVSNAKASDSPGDLNV